MSTHPRPNSVRSLSLPLLFIAALTGCAEEPAHEGAADAHQWGVDVSDGPDVTPGQDDEGEIVGTTYCDPTMYVFPVGDAHNIGYDNASCGTGTCDISCPDTNANSDWGGDHHGIDVFAYQRAPLVAAADGQVVRVGTPSDTSGLRVRLKDACGWEYYYGHMDEAVVYEGQWVSAGDLLGYMGYTGTGSTHLHFNISPDGDYSDDIDPFNLLYWTSATACSAAPAEPEPEAEPEPDPEPEAEPDDGGTSGGTSSPGGDVSTGACGWAVGDTAIYANDYLISCDGRFWLYMQEDGNLILSQWTVGTYWSTGTGGNSGAVAVMQDDGNLVVYSSGGTPLWYTGTHLYPGADLFMQDDGNLVIYSGSTAVWNSETCCR